MAGAAKEYQGERTASSIVTWANGEVPMRVTGLRTVDTVAEWAKSVSDSRQVNPNQCLVFRYQHASAPRALLLTTQPKVPVMWKVLASRYYDDKTKSKKVEFGAIKDVDGDIARALGLTGAAGGKSKVALWKRGGNSAPTLYDGMIPAVSYRIAHFNSLFL